MTTATLPCPPATITRPAAAAAAAAAFPCPPDRVVGLTVDQYEYLIRHGRLRESAGTELIDGQIVRKDRSRRGGDPMSIGEEHAWVVTSLGELVVDLVGTGASVRTQQPISIPPRLMPEPDGAIVLGSKADYLLAHPGPADVLCVVEVADSSLAEDRTVKLAVYAAAGLGPYLIVNIPDRQVEWHDGPRPDGTYADRRVVRAGEPLPLPVGDGRTVVIPADRLIPPGPAVA